MLGDATRASLIPLTDTACRTPLTAPEAPLTPLYGVGKRDMDPYRRAALVLLGPIGEEWSAFGRFWAVRLPSQFKSEDPVIAAVPSDATGGDNRVAKEF